MHLGSGTHPERFTIDNRRVPLRPRARLRTLGLGLGRGEKKTRLTGAVPESKELQEWTLYPFYHRVS